MIVKEVCVDNIYDALSAVKKGANRLELCSDLEQDGLTPSYELLIEAKLKLTLPVRVMVRPHSKSFVYNEDELNQMKKTINYCKKMNFDGVVFGCLNEKLELDLKKIEVLSILAKPLKVIIHKAIDFTNSPLKSLKKLIQIDLVDGVLTSGGAKTALHGIEVLNKLMDVIPENFDLISAGKITNQKLPISSIRIKKFCANSSFTSVSQEVENFKPPFSLDAGLLKTLKHDFELKD